MDTMIKPSTMLVERLQSIKAKHGVDPRSVSTGECLDLMELMAGYLLGHDKVLEEVAADMVQTMRVVTALRQEVSMLRRRARRWGST